MTETYAPRMICVRCGTTTKDFRGEYIPCFSWGAYYRRHIYNSAPLTIAVHLLTPKGEPSKEN